MVPTEQFMKRFQEALKMRNMTQIELSRRTGIDRGSINHYYHGHWTPNREKLAMIGSALRVNPVWLMGYDIPYQLPAEPVDDTVTIPVLGTVAAGQPLYATENIVGTEKISSSYGMECFALQIHGTSMEPKIWDNDVVIVRRQDCAESGQIVIALVGDEEATCKKLQIYDDGTVVLVPLNPAYSPIVFPKGKADFKIIGVVLESRSKF